MHILNRVAARITDRIPIGALPSHLTRSIVSVTFDDFAKSSWRIGGPILARYEAPATYFVSGSFAGRSIDRLRFFDPEDLAKVHSAGHEIGNHTYSHHDVRHIANEELLADIGENERFIRAVVSNVTLETFAYPYGRASLRTKILLARHFACCRGTEAGVNRGLIDLSQLKVLSLEARQWDADSIDRYIAYARRVPCWIIFLTHDVSDNPTPYGSTPAMLKKALAETRAANIEILTVRNALIRTCFGSEFFGQSI